MSEQDQLRMERDEAYITLSELRAKCERLEGEVKSLEFDFETSRRMFEIQEAREKEARWLLTHLPDSHQFNPQPDWWQCREAWLKGGGQP